MIGNASVLDPPKSVKGFIVFITLLGVIVMALIIGGASSAVMSMYSLQEAQAAQMNSIDDFMHHNMVSPAVRASVRGFYKALWLHGKAMDHSTLFERLPATLMAELRYCWRLKGSWRRHWTLD
jgi:cyclic nucleotide gated channel